MLGYQIISTINERTSDHSTPRSSKKHVNIKFNFEQFCNYVLIKESEDHFEINLKSFQTKMQALSPTTS